jgi:hypothetical protein
MKDEIAGTIYAKEYTDWHIKTGGFARDMTLRDHFAAQAMTTMFYPAIMESIRTDEDLDCLEVAGFAYKMADAMLKERNK